MKRVVLSQIVVAVACIGVLSGCQKGADGNQERSTTENKMVQQTDPCDATKVADYLGLEPSAEIKQKVTDAVGKREVRYLPSGHPPSADRNNRRLNADLDPEGRIDMFWCG